MKNVMIPEELFGKIIKYHLLDQEQEADDIRKGLEKKLDAMVNREVYSKSKTAPTEEEREKFRQEYLDKKGIPCVRKRMQNWYSSVHLPQNAGIMKSITVLRHGRERQRMH